MFNIKPMGDLTKSMFPKLGIVRKVYNGNSRNTNDKRLYCDITVFPAGQFDSVPIYGGGFDYNTNFPHGLFCLPRENQMVVVLFLDGKFENPIAGIPLPYNYENSDSGEKNFYDLLESINDIVLFHYSGARIILRESGKIEIQKRIEESENNFVNHSIEIEIKFENNISKKIFTDKQNNNIIEMTENSININGDSKNLVTHAELQTILTEFASAINSELGNKKDETGTTGTLTIDISDAKAEKIKTS